MPPPYPPKIITDVDNEFVVRLCPDVSISPDQIDEWQAMARTVKSRFAKLIHDSGAKVIFPEYLSRWRHLKRREFR